MARQRQKPKTPISLIVSVMGLAIVAGGLHWLADPDQWLLKQLGGIEEPARPGPGEPQRTAQKEAATPKDPQDEVHPPEAEEDVRSTRPLTTKREDSASPSAHPILHGSHPVQDAPDPEVQREELEQDEIVHSVNPTGIDEAIKTRRPQIRTCYEAWQQIQPDLAGRIVVKFTIAPTEEDPSIATVTEVTIKESELDHVWMEGCVASAIEGVLFEAAQGGGVIKVSYPFVFGSEE